MPSESTGCLKNVVVRPGWRRSNVNEKRHGDQNTGESPVHTGAPGTFVPDDLAVFVVVDVLAVVADGSVGGLGKEVTRYFDELFVLPLALFDDTRRHTRDLLGLVERGAASPVVYGTQFD